MNRRRIWAIPGLTGVVLVLALPFGPVAGAEAAGGITVTINSPGDGQKISSSDVVTVSGQVGTQALLASIDTIDVRYAYNGSVFNTTRACGPCGSEVTVPFSVTSPALDMNGTYSIEVVANGHVLLNGFGLDGAAARSFVVAVPPGPPTALKTDVLPDRKVKLTWTAPAKTPDFLGYVVYRKIDANGFAFLGVTKETIYTDDKTAQIGGAIQYQVASVRSGAVPADPDSALQTPSAAVVAQLPPLPTTSTTPGATTTTQPGAGKSQTGTGVGADLSSLLPPSSQTLPTFPPAAPPPTLPDTGFSTNLPFPSTTVGSTTLGGAIEGRQQGRSASASGEGQLESPGGDTNRRALLVPVAAGSVLCVTALHLRWLNRRIATSAATATATKFGAGAKAGGGAGGAKAGGAKAGGAKAGTAAKAGAAKAGGAKAGKAGGKAASAGGKPVKAAKASKAQPSGVRPIGAAPFDWSGGDLEPLPPGDPQPVGAGAGAGPGSRATSR